MAFPVVWMAFLLSAADRGLNYSLQQSTKETLYIPLSDTQRYKGKAFIDMLVDRASKALSAIALIGVIAVAGTSVTWSLSLAVVAMLVWLACATSLGSRYEDVKRDASGSRPEESDAAVDDDTASTHPPPTPEDPTSDLP